MKRISTGERVSMDVIRRGIDQLRFSHSDPASTGDQLLVNELMDTTPSSSFEEEAWRDGYAYEQDTSVICMRRDFSDDDYAAGSVVDGKVALKSKKDSDLFEKVEVERLPENDNCSRQSLLSDAVAALKKQENQKAQMPSPTASARLNFELIRYDSKESMNDIDDDNEEMDMADSGGCSARQLISAVLKQCQVEKVSQLLLDRPPHAYDLRIADDCEPDLDFPELDSAAAIIDVGVDEFVLCEAGGVRPLLVVNVVVEGGIGGGTGGSSLVLQVSFFEPKNKKKVYQMTLPIELLPDPLWHGANDKMQTRRRGSSSRTSGISMEGSSGDPSALMRIRNIDTGEEINVRDYDSRVPKGISPKKVFGKGSYITQPKYM